MSCFHGNHIDDCDICKEIDSSFDAGYKEGLKEQRQPLEGVIEIKTIGYHSLQLIFRSQADIDKFKATHGITGEQK